jgi:AcrR family transcriptional regulator
MASGRVSSKEKGSGFELRREQILCAARTCFSAYGFHGTSIANLSKSSGMSIGHIYHYFQNKEAIIKAIAEEALAEILEVHADILDRPDMLEGLLSHTVETAVQFSRLENSKLRLEIMSEAARNACLARMVRDFDQRIRDSALRILKCIDASRGACSCDTELESRFELMSALVSGFLTRSVKGCRIDEHVLRQSLRRALLSILMPDISVKTE